MKANLSWTQVAWITSPDHLLDFLAATSEKEAASHVHLTGTELDMTGHGWIKVGNAVLSMAAEISEDQLRQAGFSACEQGIKDIQAKAEAGIKALRERQNKLLSLSYTPSEPPQKAVVAGDDDDIPF